MGGHFVSAVTLHIEYYYDKPVKDFMKSKFQEWYSNIIWQLENEEVDMRLSVLKPLSAKWIMEMHNYFMSQSSIIINDFREVGIVEILHIQLL